MCLTLSTLLNMSSGSSSLPNNRKQPIPCPSLDSPWQLLTREEKEEVRSFMDELMPAPRWDPNADFKYKNHLDASMALIKFMHIKFRIMCAVACSE